MIIFGTKGRSIKMDSGEFHCPDCNTPRTYNKKYVQDWFTLYFIPTFGDGSLSVDKLTVTLVTDEYFEFLERAYK